MTFDIKMNSNSNVMPVDSNSEEEMVSSRPRFIENADIYLATRTGDLKRVKHLVEKENVDVNRRDCWDSVPLYYACLCGHADIVTYLLKQGAVCSENTFDGDRCLYGALTTEIHSLLLQADVTKVPPLKPLGESIRKLCDLCDDPEQPIPLSRSFEACCDFALKVGDRTYRLHKAILAARSPDFDEMLSSQSRSEDLSRFNWTTQVDPAAFGALLVYIYSERVDMETKDVKAFHDLAKNLGCIILAKMTSMELQRIRFKFKTTRKDTAPKRFVIHPHAFPFHASMEHQLRQLRLRSIHLDQWMRASTPSDIEIRTDYADAVLNIQDEWFRVHICILCARSDYFHSLIFSSENGFDVLPKMQCPIFGSSMYLIHISDARPIAVKHLLVYLYTHEVETMTETELMDIELLSELFALSERFLIFPAKRVIGEKVKMINKSFHDVCQLLIVADYYGVAVLRDHCLETIAESLEEILEAPMTSLLRQSFENLVLEVAPKTFSDVEALFDSSAMKSTFRGVIDGVTASGIGVNTILEDLREKYLELYGWEGEERDNHAFDFDQHFLRFAKRCFEQA